MTTDRLEHVANATTEERLSVCRRPIFVMGSPRSGTSVLAWALAEHSQLWTSAESRFLSYLYGRDEGRRAFDETVWMQRNWLAKHHVGREEFLRFLGLGINALFTSRNPDRRWIDQTPGYALIADTIAELFPDAFFLHMLRDGRRVVNSMIHFGDRRRLDGTDERTYIPPWERDFGAACRTWSQHVEAALTFAAYRPDRCRTILYEELVANPTDGFAALFQVLDLPPEPAPAHFLQLQRINSSFSRHDHTRPSSADWPDPWSSWSIEQQRTFLREAAPTLIRAGFATTETVSRLRDEVERERAQLLEAVPQGASVLVVSKGDGDLLHLEGRHTRHFPQDDTGGYAGWYPAQSDDAIAHLESLRLQGAQFLLFPSTAFWWLEHYEGLRLHLERHYRLIHLARDDYRLFALT